MQQRGHIFKDLFTDCHDFLFILSIAWIQRKQISGHDEPLKLVPSAQCIVTNNLKFCDGKPSCNLNNYITNLYQLLTLIF